MVEVVAVRDQLSGVVSSLDASLFSSDAAASLLSLFAEIESLACCAKVSVAARVSSSGLSGSARDVPSFVALQTGSSRAEAVSCLQLGSLLADAPGVADAYRTGLLSTAQASVVARGVVADPSTESSLLSMAQTETVTALDREVRRLERDSLPPDEQVHARRYGRVDKAKDGGVLLRALFSDARGAEVRAVLEAEADAVFSEAHKTGHRESRSAYFSDALYRLLTGRSSSRTARASVVVRVDAGALRRGDVNSGEVCEVAGLGPVSVSTARELMDGCVWRVLMKHGRDVTTVAPAHGTRYVPDVLNVALTERDDHCSVPQCDETNRLERDHVLEFAKGGTTDYLNLVRLCPKHHRMKTRQGWRIERHRGHWLWLSPPAGGGRSPSAGLRDTG